MKKWMETKNGALFSAIICTIIALMYVAAALKMGVYAAFARPSLFANGMLFGVSVVLAAYSWLRWLFLKPGQEPEKKEFYQREHSPLVCWGLAAFCGAGALVCVLYCLFLEWSGAALAAAAFMLLCGCVWIHRNMKNKTKKD